MQGSPPGIHWPVTYIGHNAAMTLFDVSEFRSEGRTDATPSSTAANAASDTTSSTAGNAWSDDAGIAPDVVETDGNADSSEPERRGGSFDALPEVEVRISARRKKTSEARWVGDRIVVSLPLHLDIDSRQKTIDWLVQRLLTRHHPQAVLDDEQLLARAIELSERYLIGARPVSVRWVTNQTARWASCSNYSGHIRVSHRLRAVPGWVLDSVLVHEVAHLTYPDHSPAFHRLASAYPRHEEAGVFLAGYGLGLAARPKL
jgi:YgjP-like, metallopeptidase domain